MAHMIPEAVPYGRPNSERRVFSTLQALPDDCWVYFEPLISGRYPDFIVFIPDCGLLVIEVKGWQPQTLLGGDHQSIQLRSGSAANPIRQARDYMVTLMDRARKDPAAGLLLHRHGPHRGRFVFPFGYVGILSQITDRELRNHPGGDLRQVMPPSHVVTADEFEAWADLTGAGLKDRLAAFFDPRWPLELAPAQVDAIRAIVHPEVALPRTPNQIAVAAAIGQLRLPEEEPAGPGLIRTMDLEQERQARTLGAGHRLLFGVAGSGKTIVLIARAKFLSEALPNARILVLCFNVAFKRYLAAVLETCANVHVYSFHGWGGRNGLPWSGQVPGEYGARLLRVLQDGGRDAAAFDAVLIDEAQDFEPTWFQCVTLAMKEPRNGDLLIVGDRNQTNYKLGRISWKDLGIEAKGRSRILRRNYRNTRPIQAAAAAFSESDEAHDGIPATACEPATAWRDSRTLPALLRRSSRLTELQAVFDIVQGLLAGSFLDSTFPPLKAEEIGLLYRKSDASGLLEAVVEHLSRLAPVVWLNQPRPRFVDGASPSHDNRQRVLEPGIKLQTIHSAKGLQYRAVVLIFADQIGALDLDLQEERRLLYVALTRPEDFLAVTCSVAEGESPSPLLGELLNSPAFRVA